MEIVIHIKFVANSELWGRNENYKTVNLTIIDMDEKLVHLPNYYATYITATRLSLPADKENFNCTHGIITIYNVYLTADESPCRLWVYILVGTICGAQFISSGK